MAHSNQLFSADPRVVLVMVSSADLFSDFTIFYYSQNPLQVRILHFSSLLMAFKGIEASAASRGAGNCFLKIKFNDSALLCGHIYG